MECIHEARIVSYEAISPQMVRVGLALTEPGAWVSTGAPDEFVHVDVEAETLDADGHSERHYSVSRVTDVGFEMEIFLHGHGPGSTWGRNAAVGQAVKVSDPKAYYAAPATTSSRVLLGDLTALPAIARILAEAEPTERFRVVVEVPSLSERRDLPTAADARVEWRLGGNGVAPSIVCDAIRHLHADGHIDDETYVWVACESAHSRRARKLLRGDLGLPIKHLRLVGYWHEDLEHVMTVWDALPQQVKDDYAALWRDDRTDEENWIELEPFLERLGV